MPSQSIDWQTPTAPSYLRFDGTGVGWNMRDIPVRLYFDPSIQGTQPIVRLARRCPPHRRRLRRHLGQLVVLFHPVCKAIKYQSLGNKSPLWFRSRMICVHKTKRLSNNRPPIDPIWIQLPPRLLHLCQQHLIISTRNLGIWMLSPQHASVDRQRLLETRPCMKNPRSAILFFPYVVQRRSKDDKRNTQ